MNMIVKIQSIIRGYIYRKLVMRMNNYIIIKPSKYQDKKWRKNTKWYNTGKQNECEEHQRNLVNKITKNECKKTNIRINMITKEITNKTNPMKDVDGFEWTEDFDGIITLNNIKFYFNLKFICDAGGAQTRSQREVNHFIQNQLDVLVINSNTSNEKIYFVNILDGDTSYKNLDKYIYLVNKPQYTKINKKLFVGDMYNFQQWWKIHLNSFIII